MRLGRPGDRRAGRTQPEGGSRGGGAPHSRIHYLSPARRPPRTTSPAPAPRALWRGGGGRSRPRGRRRRGRGRRRRRGSAGRSRSLRTWRTRLASPTCTRCMWPPLRAGRGLVRAAASQPRGRGLIPPGLTAAGESRNVHHEQTALFNGPDHGHGTLRLGNHTSGDYTEPGLLVQNAQVRCGLARRWIDRADRGKYEGEVGIPPLLCPLCIPELLFPVPHVPHRSLGVR